MNIDQNIFKAYDIRGIYPSQINEADAYALGRAYATFFLKDRGPAKDAEPKGTPKIAVGSDMRISSPALKGEVIRGLIESGLDVVDIGLASTPTFYFAVARFGYDGGIQVSASHNPKEYNGLKIVKAHALPVSKDSGIFTIRDIILNDAFLPLAETPGTFEKYSGDIAEQEVQNQLEESHVAAQTIKPFTIVIDGSNGMGSVDMKTLFEHLPQCKIISMNFELDGTFPGHGGADPMKDQNTQALRERVVAEHADLGIAPDGDADRIFFFDEKGQLMPQAILRGIMAQIELAAHPDATVAYDIRPGKITKDMIDEVGGKSIVTPVGHSIIKEIMIKDDVIFGGESSGHYFYKLSYGTFEAPMVLILKFLNYLSQQNKPLSEVLQPYKKYFNSGEINTAVADADAVKQKIVEIRGSYSDGQIQEIDGLSVEYPDWWFNLRGSNTEPLLRLTVEARRPELMEEKRDELLKAIRI
jgi:phosphomannomutase